MRHAVVPTSAVLTERPGEPGYVVEGAEDAAGILTTDQTTGDLILGEHARGRDVCVILSADGTAILRTFATNGFAIAA